MVEEPIPTTTVVTVDSALQPADCQYLIMYLDDALGSVPQLKNINSSFDGREVDYRRVTDNYARGIMRRMREMVCRIGEAAFEWPHLVPDFTDLVVWHPGQSIAHHVDNEIFPHRRVSAVIYLNAAYKGGHTRFEDPSHPRIEPCTGRMIVFRSAVRHWVTPVAKRSKTARYTMALWATDDPAHQEVE